MLLLTGEQQTESIYTLYYYHMDNLTDNTPVTEVLGAGPGVGEDLVNSPYRRVAAHEGDRHEPAGRDRNNI